jgi:hypothetical protein
MAQLRSLPLALLTGALLCASALFSAPNLIAQSFAPTVRIVDRIDESNLVTLKGNTHPAANAKNDRGRVSPTLPMTDLILVLRRSPEQQAAFDKFVASQYDSASPDFHKWLTPEQVGENFGPSQTDLATISNWLTGHGFSVDEVTKDRMSIRFSGAAAQVESAFRTEIHNLEVKGVAHIGNMTDAQIPAALAPAIVGVKALHNFFPKPLHRMGSQVTRDSETGKWKRLASAAPRGSTVGAAAQSAKAHPLFGINVPASGGYSAYQVEDVAPYDFATIYNILPLWNASTAIDGKGQIIAIAGTSAIEIGTSIVGSNGKNDVKTFRTIFGLPTTNTYNTPILQSGNSKPLTVCTSTASNAFCGEGDLIENTLDVEWSGAIAKNAQIVLVSSYPASASDDNLYDSESYIVNNVGTASSPVYGVHVMNVSYGECELFMGTAGNTEYNTLWQTAASEGIAVFVASGDSDAASCDQGGDTYYGTPYPSEYGLTVSGLASTPFNTAVGGTDFNWCSLTTTSECTPAPYWSYPNNSTTGATALGYVPEVPWNDTCASPIAVSFLNVDWAQPLGFSGVTDAETACNFVLDNYLSIYRAYGVDLSVLIDTVGGSGGASSCTTSDGANVSSCSGGYAKPSWQSGVPGIPNDGKRDLPDVSFFASDGLLSSSSYLICVSDVAACTYSTSSEPFAQEVGGTSVATPAMAGVMALINQKAGVVGGSPAVNADLYALAAKQNYSSCSAESATTGNGCYFNDIDTGNNATPCDDGYYNSGVASPNCSVLYSADQGGIGILPGYNAGKGYDQATGLGSLNVANVVNNWPASLGASTATVTVTPAHNTVVADTSLSVSVAVSGASGTPTGTVTLSGGGYTSAAETLSSGAYTFTIPADSLNSGVDTLSVSYSGDTTYAAASGSASVTVTKLTPTVSVNPSSTNFNSNTIVTVTGSVAGTGSDPTPTGTVTLSGGGYTSASTTLDSSGKYSITIPYNSLAVGTYPLDVLYSGDATYNSQSGSATVTVTFIAALTPTVTVTPAKTTVDSADSLSVTAKVTGTGATPARTVTLSGGGYTSSAQTLVAGSYTFTIPANSLNVGTDPLTVAYSGDANYYAGSGVSSVTVVESVFSLAATSITSLTPGATSGNTSTVTVSTATDYAGTATLTCALTNYPIGASDLPTCSVSNGTNVAMGGTATVAVVTTAATAELAYPKLPGKGRGWAGAGSGAVLALLLFLGIPARRRSWRSMLGILVVMAALGSLTACGGVVGGSTNPTNPGTSAGSYTFTVTGTGSSTGNLVETTTFTATVN